MAALCGIAREGDANFLLVVLQLHSVRNFSAVFVDEITDWRSRLSEETLDHLMSISINGPPLSEFDPNLVVQRFFSTPRRPEATPYGSHKLNRSELETEREL